MGRKNSYIQIRIDDELKKRVQYICDLEYTTVSSLVIRLLAEYVMSSDFDKKCFDAWLIENGKLK